MAAGGSLACFSRSSVIASAVLNRLRKNSDFDLVLKGRGFSRAVSATKSIAALAAEVTLCAREGVFPQPVKRCPDAKLPSFIASRLIGHRPGWARPRGATRCAQYRWRVLPP